MVNINKDSIRIAEDGTVFGNIFLLLKEDNFFFPQNEWNDFILVVLSWWSREIIHLLNGDIEIGSFCFMDGGYEFLIGKNPNNTYYLQCINNPFNPKIVYEIIEIDINEFLVSLYSSIKEVAEILISKKDIKIKDEGIFEYLKDLESVFRKS